MEAILPTLDLLLAAAKSFRGGDLTAIYLNGWNRATREAGTVELVLVAADALDDAAMRALASTVAETTARLRMELPRGERLAAPLLAKWPVLVAHWTASAAWDGIAFMREGKLLLGSDRRPTALAIEPEALREQARFALTERSQMLLERCSGSAGDVDAHAIEDALGEVVRAHWLLDTGDWIASFPLLLALEARARGGALAALHESLRRNILPSDWRCEPAEAIAATGQLWAASTPPAARSSLEAELADAILAMRSAPAFERRLARRAEATELRDWIATTLAAPARG